MAMFHIQSIGSLVSIFPKSLKPNPVAVDFNNSSTSKEQPQIQGVKPSLLARVGRAGKRFTMGVGVTAIAATVLAVAAPAVIPVAVAVGLMGSGLVGGLTLSNPSSKMPQSVSKELSIFERIKQAASRLTLGVGATAVAGTVLSVVFPPAFPAVVFLGLFASGTAGGFSLSWPNQGSTKELLAKPSNPFPVAKLVSPEFHPGATQHFPVAQPVVEGLHQVVSPGKAVEFKPVVPEAIPMAIPVYPENRSKQAPLPAQKSADPKLLALLKSRKGLGASPVPKSPLKEFPAQHNRITFEAVELRKERSPKEVAFVKTHFAESLERQGEPAKPAKKSSRKQATPFRLNFFAAFRIHSTVRGGRSPRNIAFLRELGVQVAAYNKRLEQTSTSMYRW